MKRLDVAFIAMGSSCSISQVLLAREFLNIFSGNELILGILFVNWLLCIALGSWFFGGLIEKPEESLDWLIVSFILISIVLPLQILFARLIGVYVVAERGEMAGLLSTFYSTLFVLLPFCSLHGFQFALGCNLYFEGSDEQGYASQISRIYVYEALGSVVGGLLFTYLLVKYLRVFEMSVGLSLLNLLLAMIFLGARKHKHNLTKSSKIPKIAVIILLAMGAFTLLSGIPRRLDTATHRWQWKGLGLVHIQNSVYGNIAITKSGDQLDFWVNGLPLFTAPHPDIEFIEESVHLPLLQHLSPEKVLVIGGGLGGALEEALKHPIDKITYVELDPLIIDLAKRYSEEASEILEDPRLEIIQMDGKLFVKRSEDSFDVVVVSMPPPSTLQVNRFYTLEFFSEVEEILNMDGVLSMSLPSSISHMTKEMGARNRCIYEAIIRVFPNCLIVPGDYNIFIASRNSEEGALTFDPSTLHKRIVERGLETSLLTEDYLGYKLSPERIKIGLEYLKGEKTELNRDMKPVATYHDLALWNTMFIPQTRTIFSFLLDFNLWWLLFSLSLIALALMMMKRRFDLFRTSIYLTIFTTGLAGMLFSFIVLYAFQILSGYLYQELGVVAAAFMLGLALGGLFMSRMISKIGGYVSMLYKIELAIIGYSFFVPVAVSMVTIYSNVFILQFVKFVFPLLNCAGGFLVGLEFPLASRICLSDSRNVGGVAGRLYASDLFGACLGSLMSSIWLIPLHGVLWACIVAATVNVVSFVLLYDFVNPTSG